MFDLFVCFDSLCPSQQFFRHFGTGLPCTKQRIKVLAEGHNTVPLVSLKKSKILNTFLVLFEYERLVILTEFHKMFVKIANREDPEQTDSSETV